MPSVSRDYPPEKCTEPDCPYHQYKYGLCYQHYEEAEAANADRIHDERRDREYERECNEPR